MRGTRRDKFGESVAERSVKKTFNKRPSTAVVMALLCARLFGDISCVQRKMAVLWLLSSFLFSQHASVLCSSTWQLNAREHQLFYFTLFYSREWDCSGRHWTAQGLTATITHVSKGCLPPVILMVKRYSLCERHWV